MNESGRIFQINASDGGVPKPAIRSAEVTSLGLADDRHNDTKYHGGPERALCLFSLERILALQAEGHPIYPGAIGENITVSSLDWSRVVPGTRMRLGDEVLIEITHYTSPCSKIAASFADGDHGRVAQTQYPGWSRVYARVLRVGNVRIGDVVKLQE